MTPCLKLFPHICLPVCPVARVILTTMCSKESPNAPDTTSEIDPTLPQNRPDTTEAAYTIYNEQNNTIKPPDPVHDVPCITQVRPNLFIGNYAAARSPETLERHRITAVVSLKTADCLAELAAISRCTSFVPKGRHFWLKINDHSKSDLLAFFEYICDFIDKMMATPPELWNDKPNPDESGSPTARGVLVYCHAGMSRSATATVAYLMRTERVDSAEVAVAKLRQIHSRVNPNRGFRRQLEIWRECGYTGVVGKAIDFQVMRPYLAYLTKERMALPEKYQMDRLIAFMTTHVYAKVITAKTSNPVRTSPMTALDASAYARTTFACHR